MVKEIQRDLEGEGHPSFVEIGILRILWYQSHIYMSLGVYLSVAHSVKCKTSWKSSPGPKGMTRTLCHKGERPNQVVGSSTYEYILYNRCAIVNHGSWMSAV